MTAFNVVRYKVKAGMEEKFLQDHRDFQFNMPGFRRGHIIKTGDQRYCFVGEWDSAADSINAEQPMVAMLNQFRDTLEEQPGVGLTDFVVGEALVEY